MKTLATKIFTASILTTAFFGLASTAWAGSPSYHEMKKVKYLAHEISDGARYLYEKSSSYAHHGKYQEKALYALHELSKKAHRFYRTSDRYYKNPNRTEDAFRDMIYAYYDASEAFRYLPAYSHYSNDFRCLRDLMDDLVAYYGGYGYYSRHDRGHGSYKPGYGSYEPGYGSTKPGYGSTKPGYGSYKPGYGYRSDASRNLSRAGRILGYIAREIEIDRR